MLFGNLTEGTELIRAGIGNKHINAAGLRLHDLVDPVDVGKLRRVRRNSGNTAGRFPLQPCPVPTAGPSC